MTCGGNCNWYGPNVWYRLLTYKYGTAAWAMACRCASYTIHNLQTTIIQLARVLAGLALGRRKAYRQPDKLKRCTCKLHVRCVECTDNNVRRAASSNANGTTIEPTFVTCV